MSLPIHRFSHLKGIWKNVLDAGAPKTNINLDRQPGVKGSDNFSSYEINFLPPTNRISDFYLNKGLFRSDNNEVKRLKTFCEGRVIPTEPSYIKFLADKKRQEVLELAMASADYQGFKEFTLAHLILASSFKDPEFSILVYKSGLGPESLVCQLGIPLVISESVAEIKPDEVSTWIINHSKKNDISIFQSICHFLCDVRHIEKHGVEPGLIIESIKNPYGQESILWIDAVPEAMKNNID